MDEDQTSQRDNTATAEVETNQRKSTANEDMKRKELKYLDFVKAAILYIAVCLARLYEYARENSGPARPGVKAVEGCVKAVVGPVYRKFHGVPFHLLQILDHKVDDAIQRLDRNMPDAVKKASSQAMSAAQRTPAAARCVANEVQRSGLADAAASIARDTYAKCEPTAKELYAKYEPIAVEYAASAWRSMKKMPVVPRVLGVVVPVVKFGMERYNAVVGRAVRRGYVGARYMPEFPVERVARAFREKSS